MWDAGRQGNFQPSLGSALVLTSIRHGGVKKEFVGEKDAGRWRMGMWRVVGYDWPEMDLVYSFVNWVGVFAQLVSF